MKIALHKYPYTSPNHFNAYDTPKFISAIFMGIGIIGLMVVIYGLLDSSFDLSLQDHTFLFFWIALSVGHGLKYFDLIPKAEGQFIEFGETHLTVTPKGKARPVNIPYTQMQEITINVTQAKIKTRQGKLIEFKYNDAGYEAVQEIKERLTEIKASLQSTDFM